MKQLYGTSGPVRKAVLTCLRLQGLPGALPIAIAATGDRKRWVDKLLDKILRNPSIRWLVIARFIERIVVRNEKFIENHSLVDAHYHCACVLFHE